MRDTALFWGESNLRHGGPGTWKVEIEKAKMISAQPVETKLDFLLEKVTEKA